MRHGPDAEAVVKSAEGVERIQEVLRRGGCIYRDGRFDRSGNRAPDAQVAKMHKIGGRIGGHQLRLRDSIHLRAVEFWPDKRELVVADIDIILIDTEEGLIAKAGATRIAQVGG